jgi:hypothetical protein
MNDEDLGKMVLDVWGKADGLEINWNGMHSDVQEMYVSVGKALYDAGFQAGADSMKQEIDDWPFGGIS